MNFKQIGLTWRHALSQPIVLLLLLLLVFTTVSIIDLLIQDAGISDAWVEFDPIWCQHEIHVALVLVAPKLDHSTELELRDDLMRLDNCVHISFQAKFCIN